MSKKKNEKEITKDVPDLRPTEIDLPPLDPPVPNRAWTEMKNGMDIDALSEEEKRDIYFN